MSHCTNCRQPMSDFDARQSLLCRACKRFAGTWSRVRTYKEKSYRYEEPMSYRDDRERAKKEMESE